MARGEARSGSEETEEGKREADAKEAAELRGGVVGGDRDRGRLGARQKHLPSRLLNKSGPLRPPVLLAGRLVDAVDTRAYPAQTGRDSTKVPRGRIATNMLQIRDGTAVELIGVFPYRRESVSAARQRDVSHRPRESVPVSGSVMSVRQSLWNPRRTTGYLTYHQQSK